MKDIQSLELIKNYCKNIYYIFIRSQMFMVTRKTFCLVIDLEQDYAGLVKTKSYHSFEAISKLITLINEMGIPITCFVQTNILLEKPEIIDELREVAIFEPHSHSHPSSKAADVELEVATSKEIYIDFFEEVPIGYRFPEGVIKQGCFKILERQGFMYDSSLFPGWRPGRFSNIRMPNEPFTIKEANILEIPVSSFSQFITIPTSLSYLKFLGKRFLSALRFIKMPNMLIFNLHLHDIHNSPAFSKLPILYQSFYRRNINDGISLLADFLRIAKDQEYRFISMREIYNEWNTLKKDLDSERNY